MQPGNSGGALVEERGNVVGVVSAKVFAVGHRARGVAGERELRGEEQFPAPLPGVGAGSVGQAQGGEHEGAEV